MSKTVLAMTALCQYIRSNRADNNISKMIRVIEEIMEVQAGYNIYLIKIAKEKRYWKEG